tara:strand:+ start:596 stop:1222 length:627 start_codon:yes stop_codon:yes gene_type:complete
MRVLELFSGTGSISKICDELDWECVSIDINNDFSTPTIMTDIMIWNYKKDFPTGYFDLITASPPCSTFSNLRRSWIGKKLKYFGDIIVTKEMLDKDMIDTGLPLVLKMREIIDFYKPKSFWIENPKSSKMKEFITDLPYEDIAYCQYGYLYQKNTRFWNNFNFRGKKCNHKKHSNPIGVLGDNISLSEKYSLPPELVRELLISSLNNM